MTKIDDGGSAFPKVQETISMIGDRAYTARADEGGMTLRDWFAGQVEIPEGMEWSPAAIMGEEAPKWPHKCEYENAMKCVQWWALAVARYRYIHADAMFAARNEVKHGEA